MSWWKMWNHSKGWGKTIPNRKYTWTAECSRPVWTIWWDPVSKQKLRRERWNLLGCTNTIAAPANPKGAETDLQETTLSANKNDITPFFPLIGFFLWPNCTVWNFQHEGEIRHFITEWYGILSDLFCMRGDNLVNFIFHVANEVCHALIFQS